MKRLMIDLDICSKCGECGMLCSYTQHPGNNGVTSLREFAHFALQCRRCEDSPCVASCTFQALEFQDYNALKRYMMRCTSCKSCSRACPFGVIYPETIPFIAARCDLCLGRITGLAHPICVESCSHGGLRYEEFDDSITNAPTEKGRTDRVYKVSEHLLVKTSFRWERNGSGIPVKIRNPLAKR